VGNYVLRIRVLEEDTTPAKAHDVGKDGLKFDGSLSAEDKKDRARTNSYAKTYLVNMVKGQDYLIELDSGAFDAYLRVEDRAGKQLAFDDDGGDDTNARLVFTAPADGAYRIIVTSFENARTGAFALRVSAK
jgi:serine protease Do